MVIIRLVPDIHALYACLLCCVCKVFWKKLPLLVKIVARALFRGVKDVSLRITEPCVGILSTYNVNQHVQRPLPLLNEFRGVILLPLFFVVSKVSSKGLLAPLAVDRVGNGGKCRYGLIFAGIFKELELKPYHVSPKSSW